MRAGIATFFGLALCAVVAQAQTVPVADIDIELARGLDFRGLDFSHCLNQHRCEAKGVRLTAERLIPDTDIWQPAELYWDPIDGIGVTGGGQNDEIDADERIVVQLPEVRDLGTIWLSDMFTREHEHYGGESARAEDNELANIELTLNGAAIAVAEITADDVLPEHSFNEEISARFEEGGDLHLRFLLDRDEFDILVPFRDRNASVLISIDPGAIEPEKLAIFDGVPTVEVDLSLLLPLLLRAPIYGPGTENANRVLAILNSPSALGEMAARAKAHRRPGNLSNGEIAAVFETPVTTDGLVFQPSIDTSNDFSVAGLVFTDQDGANE